MNSFFRHFAAPVVPAAIGGALWNAVGLPLGWLMGAAVLVGVLVFSGHTVIVPKPLYAASLVAIGSSIGLSITPLAVSQILTWAPIMIAAALCGIGIAAIVAPLFARFARLDSATAFFSLLPGGVIEMANIADGYGGNRAVISSLHALRVGMIVTFIPLGLFFYFGENESIVLSSNIESIELPMLGLVFVVGGVGGWLGTKIRLPAAWLLGAMVSVALLSGPGLVSGAMNGIVLVGAQLFVGMSLGSRFKRDSMTAVPIAMMVGILVLGIIMGGMAALGAVATIWIPETVETMVLCFGIGGMAEMVLTAKAMGQNAALVAAFQTLRGLIVNIMAGPLWSVLSRITLYKNNFKGPS